MTAKEFHAWRERVGLPSWDAVAKALGMSRRTIYRYQRGEQTIPQVVALACEAIERRRAAQ